jgi:hypothetical protein
LVVLKALLLARQGVHLTRLAQVGKGRNQRGEKYQFSCEFVFEDGGHRFILLETALIKTRDQPSGQSWKRHEIQARPAYLVGRKRSAEILIHNRAVQNKSESLVAKSEQQLGCARSQSAARIYLPIRLFCSRTRL